MTDSNKSLTRSTVNCKLQPLVPPRPSMLPHPPSMPNVPHQISDSKDMTTSVSAVYEDLDRYASLEFSNVVTDYRSELPVRVGFCDSIYGFCESFSFLSDELLDIHFMKETMCANVIRSNGEKFKVPLQANLRFSIEYSQNTLAEADYKVSKLMEHPHLPKIAVVKDSSHLDSSHIKVQNTSSQFEKGEVLVLQSYVSKFSTIECVSLLHREKKSIHKSSKLVLTVNPSQLMIDFVNLKYFDLPLQVRIHDRTSSKKFWESKFPSSSTIMSLTTVKTFIASFHTSIARSTTPDDVKEADDTIKLHEIFIDVPITVQKVYLLQSERDMLIRKSKFVYDNFRPSQISGKVVPAPNDNWIQTELYETMLPYEDRAGNEHWKQATELHQPDAFNSVSSVIDKAKGSYKHKPPVGRQSDYYYTPMDQSPFRDVKASSCNMSSTLGSSTLGSIHPNVCYSSSPNPPPQSNSRGSTLPRMLNRSISNPTAMTIKPTAFTRGSSEKDLQLNDPLSSDQSTVHSTGSTLLPNVLKSYSNPVIKVTTYSSKQLPIVPPKTTRRHSKKDLLLKGSLCDEPFVDSEYITLWPINTTPTSMASTSDHESTTSSSNQPQSVTSSNKGSNANTLLQSVVTTVATSNGSVNPITSNPWSGVEGIIGSTTLMLESISTATTTSVASSKPTTSYTGVNNQYSKEKSEKVSCDQTVTGSRSSTQSNESVSSPVTTENSVNSKSSKALSSHPQSVGTTAGSTNSTLQSVVVCSLDESVNKPKPSLKINTQPNTTAYSSSSKLDTQQSTSVDSSSSKLNIKCTSVGKSVTPPSVPSKPSTRNRYSKKNPLPLQLKLKDSSHNQFIGNTNSSTLSGSVLQTVSTCPISSTAPNNQTSSLVTPNTQQSTSTDSVHTLPSTVKSVTSKPTTLSAKKSSGKDLQLEDLSCDQVLHLLDELGLSQYKELFIKERISGGLLKDLDEDVIRKDLDISPRLHRIKLLRVIEGKDKIDQYF